MHFRVLVLTCTVETEDRAGPSDSQKARGYPAVPPSWPAKRVTFLAARLDPYCAHGKKDRSAARAARARSGKAFQERPGKADALVIYGAPTDEFKKAVADFHPIYMKPIEGFIR